MDLVTQDSYERRQKQSTMPPALAKEKKRNKRTDAKNTTANQTKLPENCQNSSEEQ